MTIHVVAGLVCRDSRLLVCQRKADASYPFKWEFPGGKLEEGESLLSALRIELEEELGIEVESASELFRHSHSYPNQTVELVFFKVEAYRGWSRIKCSSASNGWIWGNSKRSISSRATCC